MARDPQDGAPELTVAGSSGPGNSHPLLQVLGVAKHYGGVQALKGVSIEVNAGEVVGIAGENGAGKSTLVRIISGLERADRGGILIDGVPLTSNSPAEHHARGIRIAPQELMLCSALSVAENICLGELPNRRGVVDRRALRTEARRRMARLGLPDMDVMRPVKSLSVVELTLVQICRAMTPGERLLIVDEPTAPMSQDEVEVLLGMLETIAASGVAILYISHRLNELLRLCGRAVVLRDGELVAELSGAELTERALVAAMFGTLELVVTGPAASIEDAEVGLYVEGLAGGNVADVTLQVRRGEIVAVYGVLGSGRDELGALIAGSTRRTRGRVSVHGQDIAPAALRAAIAAGLGYVPSERRSQGLALELSVRDNMTMGMLQSVSRYGVLRRRQEAAIAQHWVDELRIAVPSIKTPVASLSGGGQQKVLIARWLAAGATTFVLEEPTRGVDIGTNAEIHRLLRQRADAGAAILITSSDLEVVATMGDRALVMAQGRVVAELSGATEAQIAEAALASRPEVREAS